MAIVKKAASKQKVGKKSKQAVKTTAVKKAADSLENTSLKQTAISNPKTPESLIAETQTSTATFQMGTSQIQAKTSAPSTSSNTTNDQTAASKTAQTFKTVKKQVNIPNLLTLFRIWAIPAIVITFFFNNAIAAWTGVLLFFLAAISDYMDGYLARHWNQLTRFGRVLDPIADKLLIGSILLMLAFTARLGDLGIIPAVVILCREILVSGLREFLAEIKVGCPVTRLAKWKTACQMTALPMLMLSEPTFSGVFADSLYYFGQFALWGAAILTVMTGYDYWKSGRKYMDEE